MKQTIPLHYWAGKRNFGDELSKYLVEKITGRKVVYARKNESNKLLAIGSIIDRESAYCNSDIWGSGCLTKNAMTKVKYFPLSRYLKQLFSRKSRIHAVRGPLSRELLIDTEFSVPEVYGDPAILMPLFYEAKGVPCNDIGVILHQTHDTQETNQALKANGFRYISICREGEKEIEAFIDEVASCRMIFSTSLHGVIIAQAYGVPAQWLRIAGQPIHADEEFKFNDYFLGAGQICQTPLTIKSVADLDPNFTPPLIKDFKNQKKLLKAFPNVYLD